jgi:hypothetical protein
MSPPPDHGPRQFGSPSTSRLLAHQSVVKRCISDPMRFLLKVVWLDGGGFVVTLANRPPGQESPTFYVQQTYMRYIFGDPFC